MNPNPLHSNILTKVFLFLLLFGFTQHGFAKKYDITDFGAKGDGKTLNTKAIQKTIDKAYADGGGVVIIPKGRFLSGSIVLKSNIELRLYRNAVLLGSTQPDDYIKIKRWKALVMANEAKNIAITGKGSIDGQGCELALRIDSLYYEGEIPERRYDKPEKRPVPDIRPQLIEFVNCRNIKVTDIKLKNAASWVQSYDCCTDLLIDGIKVNSRAFWNNDGIDIIDCKRVRIVNCYVDAADDGICIKSFKRFPDTLAYCDDIYVGNCTVISSASAVKLGTSSYGGFKNILIEDIRVKDTYRSAIAIECYEGGFLENVTARDFYATNTGNAIFIRLGNKFGEKRETGTVKNVTIEDIKVKVPLDRPDEGYDLKGPALPFFHNVFPSSITGIPGHPVENVVLRDIKIYYPGEGDACYARMPLNRIEDVPEQISMYPEFSMFGELPAWGLYVRHVDGITISDVKLRAKRQDYRAGVVYDDVKNIKESKLKISGRGKVIPSFTQPKKNVKMGK